MTFELFILYSVLSAIMAFFWGWWAAKRRTPLEIAEFIKTRLPDRWAAYKQGVKEGYEQGLRDGQDIKDL